MTIKRRDFLAAAASAATVTLLPRQAVSQTAMGTTDDWPLGDFILRRTGTGLQLAHRGTPDQVLWESAEDGNFLAAEVATANIKDYGTPQGFFSITDSVSASYGKPTVDSLEVSGDTATVSGRLSGAQGDVGYRLVFEALSATALRFIAGAEGPGAAVINRITLVGASDSSEAFFGFGQQLTDFNQKGNLLPIIVQEHGVGRGRPIVMELVDVFADQAGGSPYITEAPAPHFISSRLRSLFLENTEYSTFDMRPARSR